MSVSPEYNDLKITLKWKLVEFLLHVLNIPVTGRKKFPCPNPSHTDRCPSAVVYENSTGPIVKCFSCGLHADIFELYSLIHGVPLSGPEFFTKNLGALAKLFGMELPKRSLSERDRHFEDVRRAYASAEKLLLATPGSPAAQAKIRELGWAPEIRQNLGIGSVNYDWYADQMQRVHGYDAMFLKKIGLLEPTIFCDNTLVYTLKDEHGQPVGFSGRNLRYDQYQGDYLKACQKFGPASQEALREKNAVPPKYFNSVQGNETRNGSPILWKGERLFGFHKAKQGGAPLYLFEGYADVATAHHAGLTQCVGVSSAGVTVKHVELLIKYRVPHVVLCLDADQGGWKGIKTFVDVLDRMKPLPPWFMAEIMYIPAGQDDPDRFIRTYGPAAFEALPRVDIYTWKLQQMQSSLKSHQDFVNRTMQLMMEEPSPCKRYRMAITAGQFLKVPPLVLYDESYSRAGQAPAPTLQLRLKDGQLISDTDIEKIFIGQPIKMMDMRVTIASGNGNGKADLVDDLIYYPVRTL